jgi:hypothetical protein
MAVQAQRMDRMMVALPAARARAMDVDRAGPAGPVKRAMPMVQVVKTQQARAALPAGHAAPTAQAVLVPVRNPRWVPEATMLTEQMEPIARTQQAEALVVRTPEVWVARIPVLAVRTLVVPIATVQVSAWAPAKAMPTTESLRSKCRIAT